MSNNLFLGILNGNFKSLKPKTSSEDLTGIAMQEATAPENKKVNLKKYEGTAIMISGHNGGGWIYSVKIVESAGPILTAVVQIAFGKSKKSTNRRRWSELSATNCAVNAVSSQRRGQASKTQKIP